MSVLLDGTYRMTLQRGEGLLFVGSSYGCGCSAVVARNIPTAATQELPDVRYTWQDLG